MPDFTVLKLKTICDKIVESPWSNRANFEEQN